MSTIEILRKQFDQRCIRELHFELDDDDLINCHKRFSILDQLIDTLGFSIHSLVASIQSEMQQRPSCDHPSFAEDIAQWLCDRHGVEGSSLAFRFREWLTDNMLADSVTRYNFAHQKLIGECCAKDPVGAHRIIEEVLKEDLNSPLRNHALIQAAMNYVDAVAVPVDIPRALSLLAEASRSGYVEGTFNMGLFYAGRFCKGETSHINMDLAACFYAMAYRAGHLGAQTNLAILHIQNAIHNSDPGLGWHLLQAASIKGDLIATEIIQKLERPLTVKQAALSRGYAKPLTFSQARTWA